MIRNSAKAIIFDNGKILFIKMLKDNKNYYILTGGGQNKFESLRDAVLRECLEETGYVVKVLDILFVRDYIARNHEFALIEPEFHQVDLEWIDLSDLRSKNIFPKILGEKIIQHYEGSGAKQIYLGDVN